MSNISKSNPESKMNVSLQDIICNSPLMRDQLDESRHQIIDASIEEDFLS